MALEISVTRPPGVPADCLCLPSDTCQIVFVQLALEATLNVECGFKTMALKLILERTNEADKVTF